MKISGSQAAVSETATDGARVLHPAAHSSSASSYSRRSGGQSVILPAYGGRRADRDRRLVLLPSNRHVLGIVALHAADAAMVAAAVVVAGALAGFNEAVHLLPTLVALVLVALNLTLSYSPRSARKSIVRIGAAIVLGAAPLANATLLPLKFRVSLSFLAAFAGLATLALTSERHLFDLLRREAHARSIGLKRAMLLAQRVDRDDGRESQLQLIELALKRCMDVVLSAMLLILLSPVFLTVAVAIRVASPGPMFFSQKRVGLWGRSFRILKFRTMRADAEQLLRSNADLYATYLRNDHKFPPSEDPRITALGRFLRATSIDELPQLVNVLRGDMSLVGPRPIVHTELKHYAGPARPVFLAVRPGMTGYWQVNGRSSVMYPDRARMDVEYVAHWSLMMDLKILLRTPSAVLRGSGAF